jgi:cytochrome c-type biogenesis protein CcmH/NrfG
MKLSEQHDAGESHERLEDERDFLLRSLDDLEAERAAGNIDDDTYRLLHDDYTARASAVIRTLETGVDVTPAEPSPPSRATRVATVVGSVVFAVVAAFLLAHAVGQRRPGQTPTGNDQTAKTATTDAGAALAAAVRTQPNRYQVRIEYARYLLTKNDVQHALMQYDAAARLDPKQPEALAYGGWIRALVAQEVTNAHDRGVLADTALARVNQAIAADPNYQDAYVFKGLILFNLKHDPKDAVPAFQEFLVLAPQDHPMRQQVLGVLAEAIKATQSTTTTRP